MLVSALLLHPQTDHKCVLDSCRYLQQRGFDVTYLPVQKNGLIDLQQLADAIRPETSLVSRSKTSLARSSSAG